MELDLSAGPGVVWSSVMELGLSARPGGVVWSSVELSLSAGSVWSGDLYRERLYNESTAGTDASVEMPKLHNIKLIALNFIHMMNILLFAYCMQTQRVGNDQDCC